MYSMLEKIDEYIKENNIPFRTMDFGYDLLDPYLDLAITNKIRRISGEHFHMGSLAYTLKYDENDNLCLIATSDNARNTYVIYNGKVTNNVSLPGRFYACPEIEVMEDAAMLRYLEHARLEIRKGIYERNPNIGVIDRVKLEFEIMNGLIHDTFLNHKQNGEHVLNITDYEKIFENTTDNILEFIKYLDIHYQGSFVSKIGGFHSNTVSNGVIRKK